MEGPRPVQPVAGTFRSTLRRRRVLLLAGTCLAVCFAVYVVSIIPRVGGLPLGLWIRPSAILAATTAAFVMLAWAWLDLRRDAATIERLRESEARLRLVALQVPSAMWTTDTDLRVTSALGGLLSPYSPDPGALVGKTMQEILGAGDDNPTIAALQRALRGESTTYDRPQGDRTIEARVAPLRGDDGAVVGAVAVGVDVTSRREAEAEAGRYRALVESSEDAILSTDLEGRVEHWNPAAERLYGYSAEEILGRRISILEPPERSGEGMALRERLLQGERPLPYETIRRRRDGSLVEIATMLSPIYDGAGHLVGVSAVVHDITERRRSEASLRENETQLRALARHLESVREEERAHMARVLHDELGQALTAVRLDLGWVGRRLPAKSVALRTKLDEMVALIDATIVASRRLVADLRPPILDDLGLVPALEWYLEHFQERAKVQVQLDVAAEPIAVAGPVAVTAYRIVQEALTNVSRHAEAKRVTVRLGTRSDALLLEIADDGKGIRTDTVGNAQSFGIIGMRERTAAHGGTLEIGRSPAGGTLVRATIPLERRGPAAQG